MSGPSRSVRKSRILQPRGWAFSVVWAFVLVGVSIAISASVNPLFGRAVHWDWMAVLAPTLLVGLILAFRRRWV